MVNIWVGRVVPDHLLISDIAADDRLGRRCRMGHGELVVCPQRVGSLYYADGPRYHLLPYP